MYVWARHHSNHFGDTNVITCAELLQGPREGEPIQVKVKPKLGSE